jgi:thiol-disulfide isomerase/thioredoxin
MMFGMTCLPAPARSARPSHPGRRLVAAFAVALTLLALAGCGGDEERTAGQIVNFAPADRVAAPEVKGGFLTGGSFDLAAHKGDIVVLNFWASWCAPCRIEVADLEAVHQAMPEVVIVGLNTDDDVDKAKAFMEGRATYPSVLDTSGKLALAFREVPPNALPATIVIDAQGRIATVIRRVTTQAELTGILTALAAEQSQGKA